MDSHINLKNSNAFKLFVQSQIYFLKLIIKERLKLFLLFSFIVFISSIIAPFSILIQKEIIDQISNLNSEIIKFKWIIILLIIYTFLVYTSEFLKEYQDYIFLKITYTVNYVLKSLMNNKLIKIPLKEFEDSSFYDTLNLSGQALQGNGIKVVQNLINIIGSIISLITLFGILTSLHWSLPIAIFLSTLPGIVIVMISKFKGYRMERELSANDRELSFTESLFFDKRSLREIKIYNSGHFLNSKWNKLYNFAVDKKMKLAFWELKNNSGAMLIIQVANIGVSIFLVYQVFGNGLTIGSYVALVTAITTMQGIFARIGGNLSVIFEIAIYNNALLTILGYEVEENEKDETQLLKIDRIESIYLKDATFCYPNSKVKVLDSVTFKINRGDRVSIVGNNGSGKTTLAYCLMGLYDLDSGVLEINGVPIAEVNKKTYFKKISIIFQDFTKYKYSLRENITIGNVEEIHADKKMEHILNNVGLNNKVKDLVYGLDTYLAKDLPDGTEFSGGEWQKVAISRAFIKDAEMILLDEPTAALDPKSELKIFELFHDLSKDKTTLTISHRIGPTRRSNAIIVMDKGKIVEKGTFEELLINKGLFYEMYNSQSQWYIDEQAKKEEVKI